MSNLDTVVFRNPGNLPPDAIRITGISVKDDGRDTIGEFGTGLKYTIAVCLREGCKIKIFTNGKWSDFTLSDIEVKGKTFKVVMMDDEQLSFTTHYGKNWSIEDAYRELYCNARDEGGGVDGDLTDLTDADFFFTEEPKEDETLVVVSGQAIVNAFHNRSSIILDKPVIHDFGDLTQHPGESHYLYYKGIRAYKLERPTQFTYNVKRGMQLTEDRTIAYMYPFQRLLGNLILSGEDETTTYKALTESHSNYEKVINYGEASIRPHDFFYDIVNRAKREHKEIVPDSIKSFIERKRVRESNFSRVKMTDQQRQMLESGCKLLKSFGFHINDYTINVTNELPSNILGQAIITEKFPRGLIAINETVFARGEQCLTATLFEEYIHLRFDYEDESRTLQDYLFELSINMMYRLKDRPQDIAIGNPDNVSANHLVRTIKGLIPQKETSTDEDLPF